METTGIYTREKKIKLAERIGKIKKKEDQIKIFEIIYESNKNITKNHTNDGFNIFFHKLSDDVYYKIDCHLNSISKPITDSDTVSDKKEYKSYTEDEFPDQDGLNPKLKCSNREKNIIKRQRYDKHITKENGNNTNYSKFDITTFTDSDNSETKPQGLTISDGQNHMQIKKPIKRQNKNNKGI